jgi:hypothetical protein
MPSEFDWLFHDAVLETTDTIPDAKKLTREARRQYLAGLQRQHLKDVVEQLPAAGESYHILSNGKYDYWTFVPVLIDMMGGRADLLYGSTWTMNRNNVVDLVRLYDEGRASKIGILTGLYFKRRETAVYTMLVEALQKRGQPYMAFRNHAKVIILSNADYYLTIEGSANFTANPRLEQYILTNERRLFDFHREWMEHMFNAR